MYKINFDEINSYLNEVAATKGYDDISYHQPLGWDSFPEITTKGGDYYEEEEY